MSATKPPPPELPDTETRPAPAGHHTTGSLYLDDNGRCLCADHAGAYLSAALAAGTRYIIATPAGTWVEVQPAEALTMGLTCEATP